MSTADKIPDILQDLRRLLPETIGKEVQVLNCTTTDLLPAGENYGSSMYKTEVTIRRKKNSPQEKLELVAKMIPTAEFQKSVIKAGLSFGKEIFVFEKLAAAYKQIEKETDLASENLRDLFPKFYGGQLSRDPEHPDEADEYALLLLENIKILGYDTMERKKGLDLEHAKLAITELARFHALGVALKTHKPAVFEESKKYFTDLPFEVKGNEFDGALEHTLQLICQDARISKYADRIKNTYKGIQTWDALITFKASEPWISLNHGDFWVNNMMFKHDGNTGVSDIKFIDFQISRITNPITDLPYFLCSSTSEQVLENHMDELLDIYYNRFIDVLRKTKCEYSRFTRKSFDEELKKIAHQMLMHNIMALKFFTLEVTEDVDMNDIMSSIMMAGGSNLYLERAWNIVKKYVEKGWI